MRKPIRSIKLILLLILSTYLVSACTTQSTLEQVERKIFYSCSDGASFWIEYPSPPDKASEKAEVSYFTKLYGKAPEECKRK